MISAKDLKPEQVENLKKLVDYLLSGNYRGEFNMECYSSGDSFEEDELVCGSIGCSIGHGPYAGIEKRIGESWNKYADRVFGNNIENIWDFLFSPYWATVDNTATGAARRILYFLEYGSPVIEDIDKMQLGQIPLIY